MTNPKWFGSRLRELREEAGLSQAQLAAKAGTKANTVARIERGERIPCWEIICAFAAALDVDLGEFGREPVAKVEKRRGRPRKMQAEPAQPKRPRGRPRKEA